MLLRLVDLNDPILTLSHPIKLGFMLNISVNDFDLHSQSQL